MSSQDFDHYIECTLTSYLPEKEIQILLHDVKQAKFSSSQNPSLVYQKIQELQVGLISRPTDWKLITS